MTNDDINAYVNAWSSGSYLNLDMIPENEFDKFISSLQSEFDEAQEGA